MKRPSTEQICNVRDILESCQEPAHPDKLIANAIISYNQLIEYVHHLEDKVPGLVVDRSDNKKHNQSDFEACLALAEFYDSM